MIATTTRPLTATPEWMADAVLACASMPNTPDDIAKMRAHLTAAFRALDCHDEGERDAKLKAGG